MPTARKGGTPAPDPDSVAHLALIRDKGVVISAHTLYLVKRLEMVVRASMEPIVRACELTVPRYTAMTVLDSTPDISSAELARRTFGSAHAANELMNGLHVRGLIARRPSPDHGKVVLLRLTKAGEQLLARCVPRVREIEEMMLRELAAETARGFRNGLHVSIRALQTEPRESVAEGQNRSVD